MIQMEGEYILVSGEQSSIYTSYIIIADEVRKPTHPVCGQDNPYNVEKVSTFNLGGFLLAKDSKGATSFYYTGKPEDYAVVDLFTVNGDKDDFQSFNTQLDNNYLSIYHDQMIMKINVNGRDEDVKIYLSRRDEDFDFSGYEVIVNVLPNVDSVHYETIHLNPV